MACGDGALAVGLAELVEMPHACGGHAPLAATAAATAAVALSGDDCGDEEDWAAVGDGGDAERVGCGADDEEDADGVVGAGDGERKVERVATEAGVVASGASSARGQALARTGSLAAAVLVGLADAATLQCTRRTSTCFL